MIDPAFFAGMVVAPWMGRYLSRAGGNQFWDGADPEARRSMLVRTAGPRFAGRTRPMRVHDRQIGNLRRPVSSQQSAE